jgi:hypothetical protein
MFYGFMELYIEVNPHILRYFVILSASGVIKCMRL